MKLEKSAIAGLSRNCAPVSQESFVTGTSLSQRSSPNETVVFTSCMFDPGQQEPRPWKIFLMQWPPQTKCVYFLRYQTGGGKTQRKKFGSTVASHQSHISWKELIRSNISIRVWSRRNSLTGCWTDVTKPHSNPVSTDCFYNPRHKHQWGLSLRRLRLYSGFDFNACPRQVHSRSGVWN